MNICTLVDSSKENSVSSARNLNACTQLPRHFLLAEGGGDGHRQSFQAFALSVLHTVSPKELKSLLAN